MREVAIKTVRIFVVYAVAALPVLACLGVGLKVLFWYYLKDDEVHVEPRARHGARRTGKRSHGHSQGGGVLAASIDYQSAVTSAGTDDEDESEEDEARQLEARRAEKERSVEKHEKKKGGRGRASCGHV